MSDEPPMPVFIRNRGQLLVTLLTLLMSWCGVGAQKTFFPTKVEVVEEVPGKDQFWIFMMAGQSNMAGRGFVEPEDTVSDDHILVLDEHNRWILAKEPLHFYEPKLTGLDCGLSFARKLRELVPDSIFIGMVPCAVGGSSMAKWLGDSVHREVKLLTNFEARLKVASEAGVVKAVLWHQGESDAKPPWMDIYEIQLNRLFTIFRDLAADAKLPILMGELGGFARPPEKHMRWMKLNTMMQGVAVDDPYVTVISSAHLDTKGDFVHFNNMGQRILGERYAEAFIHIELR